MAAFPVSCSVGPVDGRVVRTGAKLPLMIGPAMVGGAFLLFAVPGAGGSYWTTFFPAVVAFGLGMSITIAPLVTVVMSAVDQNLSGLASGINNAISRVASLMALAVLAMVALALFGGARGRRHGRGGPRHHADRRAARVRQFADGAGRHRAAPRAAPAARGDGEVPHPRDDGGRMPATEEADATV